MQFFLLITFYVLITIHFTFYTDHKNLVFLFSPTASDYRLKRHSLDKIHRWRLVLDGKRYIIESISGQDNVWADITTRWAARKPAVVASVSRSHHTNPLIIPGQVRPLQRPDFSWPKIQDILQSQRNHFIELSDIISICGLTFKRSDQLYVSEHGVVLIPSDDYELQLRLLIIAHAGSAGHRRIDATCHELKQRFFWKGMSADVEKFCKLCLHCTVSMGGEIVPRPFGEQVHGSTANSVIHFDYLYLGPSKSSWKYLLIGRCDVSSFIDLFPAESPTAHHTAESLLEWFSRYGVVSTWVSDRGSHFLNEVIANLSHMLHANHHFTLAYCPWSNGSIEIINKHILSVMRGSLLNLDGLLAIGHI